MLLLSERERVKNGVIGRIFVIIFSLADGDKAELFEGDWMGAVADAVEAQPTRER